MEECGKWKNQAVFHDHLGIALVVERQPEDDLDPEHDEIDPKELAELTSDARNEGANADTNNVDDDKATVNNDDAGGNTKHQ